MFFQLIHCLYTVYSSRWVWARSPFSVCVHVSAPPSAHLLHQDGKTLVLEGFGELDVLSSLVVDGEGSDNHVGQATQQLPHHAVPLLLVTVVHLQQEEQEEEEVSVM